MRYTFLGYFSITKVRRRRWWTMNQNHLDNFTTDEYWWELWRVEQNTVMARAKVTVGKFVCEHHELLRRLWHTQVVSSRIQTCCRPCLDGWCLDRPHGSNGSQQLRHRCEQKYCCSWWCQDKPPTDNYPIDIQHKYQ